MDFFSEEINDYVEQHSDPETPLLSQINRETHLNVLKPRMLSGHLQGRVLAMLSHMIKPKNILEIGTYTGYSALCLAEGMDSDGTLITLDKNAELENRVRAYFEASEYGHLVDFKIGNALEIIPTLAQNWDLVFIDADKVNYAAYYDLIFDQLNPGGYIISDNVLWSGKVVDDRKQDEDTKAIRSFNEKVQNDDRVENVLFPIRDGLMIARKRL